MSNTITQIKRITRQYAGTVLRAAQIFCDGLSFTEADHYQHLSVKEISERGKKLIVAMIESNDDNNGTYFELAFFKIGNTGHVVAVNDNWIDEETLEGTDGKFYGLTDCMEVYAAE